MVIDCAEKSVDSIDLEFEHHFPETCSLNVCELSDIGRHFNTNTGLSTFDTTNTSFHNV